jgi:hypothetical protein
MSLNRHLGVRTGGGRLARPRRAAGARRFVQINATPVSIAEAWRAQQLEREQFEHEAGVRLDAQGRIIRGSV